MPYSTRAAARRGSPVVFAGFSRAAIRSCSANPAGEEGVEVQHFEYAFIEDDNRCSFSQKAPSQSGGDQDCLGPPRRAAEKLASGTIPAGMKPLKLPFETDEWSQEVGSADLGALVIPAKNSDTLEDLLERVHMESLASGVVLSREVQTRRLARLEAESPEKLFIDKCPALAMREREALQDTKSLQVRPEFWTDFQADVRLAVSKLHFAEAKRIALQNLAEIEKKEGQKKQAAEALRLAGELPAEEILHRGLVEVMGHKPKVKDKRLTKVNFAGLIHIDVADGDKAELKPEQNSSSRPNKWETPAAGRGQSQQAGKGSGKPNQLAKAKATSKAKAKASPKPKAQPNASAKAGGKGQSKGAKGGGKGGGKNNKGKGKTAA